MALNPPPIQENTTTEAGKFPQVWIRWFTYICDQIASLISRVTTLEAELVDPDNEYFIKLAIDEIENTFGDTVSVSTKKKSLIKFGRNENVGTSLTTIMQFQGTELHEVYQTTNSIDKVVTTDNSFTGTVTIEGHTISGNDLTFVTQTKTLTGQTGVTLDTPLARVTRIRISSTDALAATTDKIFVYRDVATTGGIPNTTANIHALMDGKWGQTQKAATSISKDDYWLITLIYGGVLKKQAATADIALQIRKVGDSQWRTVFDLPVSSTGGPAIPPVDFPPVFVVPKNHDVRVVAEASTTGVEVAAGFAGYLASVTS